MDELEGLLLTTAMHWAPTLRKRNPELYSAPSTPRLQATPDSIFI